MKLKQSYWGGVDGLRTVAFLMVFFYHIPKLEPGSGPLSLLAKALNRYNAWGWLGVDLFFVISGFLIANLLLSENEKFGNISLKLFYARRCLRIWPSYFLVVFLSCLCLPLLSFKSLNMSAFGNFLWTIFCPACLFVSNFFANTTNPYLLHAGSMLGMDASLTASLLMPLWSLCIEEQFYLFLPIFLIAVKGTGLRNTWISVLIFCSISLRACIWLCLPNEHGAWYFNTFSHLDPLLIGVLLASVNFSSQSIFEYCRRNGLAVFLCSLGIITLTATFLPTIAANHLSIVPAVAWCSVAFAGVLACACAWTPCEKFFSNRVLVAIGRKTYAMYLWHGLVTYAAGLLLPESNMLSVWIMKAALSLLASYLLAELSWRVFESRFDSWKNKLHRKAQSNPALETGSNTGSAIAADEDRVLVTR